MTPRSISTVWAEANAKLFLLDEEGNALEASIRSGFYASIELPSGGQSTFQHLTPTDDQTGRLRIVRTLLPADATPPVITVPADITVNATSPAGANVTYTVTATDENPTNPIVTCTPASGTTFPIGDTNVACTASDASGNTATASFTVHVKGAAEQLSDLATAVEGVGLGKSLSPTVAVTQWLVAHGQAKAACVTLTVFNLEVRIQSGKTIPKARATALIADANRIKNVLGC